MAKYHINDAGEVGTCKARIKDCKFASSEDGGDGHYADKEEAQAAATKKMEVQYKDVYKGYRRGEETGMNMPDAMKRRLIEEGTQEDAKVSAATIGRVLSKDNDELIRKAVVEKLSSQKLLRDMSDDESARVRKAVAMRTNNREVLAKLANDPDRSVQLAAIKNEKTPAKARKAAQEAIKAANLKNLEKARAKNGVAAPEESAPTKAPRKRELTEHEIALRNKTAELAREIVRLRAEQGDVTFDDANPERARRRLDEAINFAKSRGNTHLASKLSSAKVLPSGSFQRNSDQKRVNTDETIKDYVTDKAIEDGRNRIQGAIQSRIDKGEITEGKYTHKDESGTYSLTVAPAIDKVAYDNLDEATKRSISSPKESLSIDLAKNKIPREKLEVITKKQQVMDFVVSKKPEIGDVPKPNLNLQGSTSEERASSGLKSLSDYTQSTSKAFGTKNDRAARKTESAEVVKSAVANRGQNTFVPGRAYGNGTLLSARTVLDSKAVQEHLTPDEIKSITGVTLQPDPVKAKSVLSKEDYSALFERQTASLRVTPKRK